MLFGAKLFKKYEINERFLRNISYFCIVKRNIWLFKRFLICVSVLLADISSAYGTENADSYSSSLDNIEVSLLTCQPHDEVYSLYGHTAIRVKNNNTGADWAVNYGVFDFNTDYFVVKFVFGITDYMMGIFPFDDFLREYRFFGSGVFQQRINLSPSEKETFMTALAENARPENLVYRYNYYYNNCTTRARDIIYGALEGVVSKPEECGLTFRELIHSKNEGHRWARVGNDMLLGVGSDKMASPEEAEFLPEYLMKDFETARVVYADGTQKALVDSAFWVLMPGEPWHPAGGADMPLTPSQCAWIVLAVILTYTLFSLPLMRQGSERFLKTVRIIDYAICCLYALAGLILFAMLFSQHPTVRVNLQILMFCPLWFFTAWPTARSSKGWIVMAVALAAFFLGNFVQSYAEGANVLALALSLIIAKNIVQKFAQSKKKQYFCKVFTSK